MKYTKGFKFQLEEPEMYNSGISGYEFDTPFYSLLKSGTIIAKAGFAWDGCSGSIDTDTNLRAGLFHDIGCLLVAREVIPSHHIKEVNRMFYNLLCEDGMNKARIWWHFKAVRMHFAKGTKPERRKIYEK